VKKAEKFLEKMGFEKTECKFGANEEYPCYFGKDTFVLCISGAARINLDALKFALIDMIEKAKEEENEKNEETGI
jgi:GTP-binding protein